MQRLLTISAIVLLPVAASAAELVVRDLEVSLSVLPTSFSYTVTSPTVSGSGDDGFSSGTELSVGGRYSLARPGDAIGLVLGADLLSDTWTYDGDGYLFATGLRASAGLGWAVSDDWTVLVEPGFRYGVNAIDLPATASSAGFSASGSFSGYDVRTAALWQVSKGFLIEAHAGWLSLSHSISGDDIDQTIDQNGLYVGIGVAWRWSTAPTRIE
jgi:hypothetical protein